MVQLVRLLIQQPFVVFQQIVTSLLYATPSLFRLLLTTAGAALELAKEAIITVIKDLPAKADRISDEATRHAIEGGFPYLWERHLKEFFYGIALLAAVGVWLLIPCGLILAGSLLF